MLAIAVVTALYVAYALSVSLSNGRLVELELVASLDAEGAVQLRCGAGSTPSVCIPGASNFTVQGRDRVHVTLVQEGNGTYSVALGGSPYWLWPAGFSLAGSGTESFTAWNTGTFAIHCSRDGGLSGPCASLTVV